MSKLLVAVLLVLATPRAHATIPPQTCEFLPARDWGYVLGAFYAGALADPICAYPGEGGLDRFPVLILGSGLVQADLQAGSEATSVRFRRARMSVTTLLVGRLALVATADAAQQSLPDAYVAVDVVRTPRRRMASDDTFQLALAAGRKIVPFSLEHAWSDANLPFLERTLTITRFAPAQRQHGVSLIARRMRHLEVTPERSDTENTLTWHVELGAFQPSGEAESYAMIGRAFVRRDRNNEYKSLDTHLHVGASAAIGRRTGNEPVFESVVARGKSQQVALEADVRYYRYRASAELVASTLETLSPSDGTRGEVAGRGATLTVSATIPVDRERWWTEPLHRQPVPTTHYVTPTDVEMPNPGFELDVGVEMLRTEHRSVTASTTAVHVAAHAFAHDFAKLSCAYTFVHAAANRHEATLRLQLAF